MNIKDSILAFIIVMVWGVNFVVIAYGLYGMPPFLLGGMRFLLVFAMGCWFVKRPNIPLKWILGYALAISFAQFGFLFLAMSLGMPAGLASLILQSQALFTLIFAYLLLKEQIKISQILTILVAGVGLALIGVSSGDSKMSLIGFVLTILAACSWALGNLVTRVISQQGYKVDSGLVVWAALISSGPFFAVSLLVDGWDVILDSLITINSGSVLSLLYLALVATILGYSLWSYLLAKYPAGVVAPLTLGVPIIGLVSASIILNENLNVQQWLGVVIVMFGLMINMRLDKHLLKSLRRIIN